MSHNQPSLLKWAKTRLSKKRQNDELISPLLCLPLEIRLLIYTQLFGHQTIHIISDCIDDSASLKLKKVEGWEKELRICCICGIVRHREVTRFWSPPCHRLCIAERFTKEQCEAYRHFNFTERNVNHPILYPIGQPRNNEADFIGPDVWLEHYGCMSKEQHPPKLDLAALRVCRQIYEEARLIPYRTNIFAFDNTWALARFCGLSLNHLRAEKSRKPKETPRVVRKNKFLNFSKDQTITPKRCLKSTLLSEIRHIQIHAAYDHDHDLNDWRLVCAKASEFFTGLEIFNLSIDLTPHGEPNLPGWIGRDSIIGLGFQAFRRSPLKTVTVDVIDEAWGVYLDDQFFRRSQAAFRTTIADKQAFAQGIKDHLLKKDQEETPSLPPGLINDDLPSNG